MNKKRVIVIGGGISGLTAAHRLWELDRERRLGLQITLLEARDRLGGLIETQLRDGFLLENGPDAFLAERPWALSLCRRIGLEDELIQPQAERRRSLILHHGKLIPMPQGFYMIAPTHPKALSDCSLLSFLGKLRVRFERFIPPRASDADESVASFVRRRFGREVLDRIAQPMIGGIYTADLEKLSVTAALPRFHEMERKHGSVLRALSNGSAGEVVADAEKASGPRYGLFLAPRAGMSRLVEVLARKMLEVELKTNSPVEGIERKGKGWMVCLRQGHTLQADAVCVALPAPQASALLKRVAPASAEELAGIPYESVATVNMAFRREDLPILPEGFGFVAHPGQAGGVVGCTFSSVKFTRRAPEDSVLLRAFVGGAMAPGAADQDNEKLQSNVRELLKKTLEIRAVPRLVVIRRHPGSMPQYHVGHLERVQRIERETAKFPGLTLTGNAYHGVGIPDCIHQAESAAERICQGSERLI